MHFRPIIILVALALLTRSAAAAEVVIVKSSEAEPYTQAEEGLKSVLTEQHHATRTVLLAEINAKGVQAVIRAPAAVVAVGTPAAALLQKKLPPTIPLAYCMVPNPVGIGLTAGRAATGVTTDVSLPVQFQMISEGLPKARNIGMLYRSDNQEGPRLLKMMETSLPAGWRLEAVAVNDHPSVAAAIEALTHKKIDLIWTAADASVYDSAAVRALLLAALRNKIPVWGFSPAFVRAGAILGVGVDPRAQGAQAAAIALKLLLNPQASLETVHSPESCQLAVNLVVAEQLGIELPEGLVRRAQFVFKGEK